MRNVYKIGDKVRRLKDSTWPWDYGQMGVEYTIASLDKFGMGKTEEGFEVATSSDLFEIIPDPVKEAITLLEGKGYHVAAPTPRTLDIVVYLFQGKLYCTTETDYKSVVADKAFTRLGEVTWTEKV